MDFVKIIYTFNKGEKVYEPDFGVEQRPTDLMVRGGDFYAVWDEDKGLWSTNEYDVQRLVDADIWAAIKSDPVPENCHGKFLSSFKSGKWLEWKRYLKALPNKWTQLDTNVVFSNTETKKEDYCSQKLPYALEYGDMSAYEEIISTLYSPKDREKIEWAIGAIISGDSKIIQKFLVLYGSAGTGKSTVLNIIQMIFDGYCKSFEASSLTNKDNRFAFEAFRSNPLVAIQHDGDLSKIEDNTKLNSLISHERIIMEEKNVKHYEMAFHSFLMMGTNTPVRITDAKSGIIRRLIDVNPSGDRLPFDKYQQLMARVQFELGAIAYHCLEVYKERGKGYYDSYVPISMISATNDFFDFVEYHYEEWSGADMITLDTAWKQYKDYIDFANIPYGLPHRKFKEELKNYFREFSDKAIVDDVEYSKLYSGFKKEKFAISTPELHIKNIDTWLKFDRQPSIFDVVAQDYTSQYANDEGKPCCSWDKVTTKLSDIDTSKLHYVLFPKDQINHIVIDFDIKDGDGKKSLIKNVEAASKFPPTYAELSKSGNGIHLHYMYIGDVNELSSIFERDVEVKIFKGNSSLRRQLTKCNDLQIANLNGCLPKKEVKKKDVLDKDIFANENVIRAMIIRNLRKEYHDDTSSSVNYISAILQKAYESGIPYDVSDLENDVIVFASQSTNQSDRCLKVVSQMHFKSEEPREDTPATTENDDKLVFFDVEVFPNLFIVVYKPDGEQCVTLINPTADRITELTKLKLVGFNNRKYDNHILYGRMMGYTNIELYRLSQRIINNKDDRGFYEANNMSYTDIYDFSSKKQGLKKWEIELGIHHHELGLKWDEPVPEELWDTVASYCVDDVIATEETFHHLKNDFSARLILADLSGGTPNDTTNTHTRKIIFGRESEPGLVYTDLATGDMFDEFNQKIGPEHRYWPLLQAYWDKFNDGKPIINAFPGYEMLTGDELAKRGYSNFKEGDLKRYNFYRGEDVGFGGYVFARPGMYLNVALLDIASMHPHSILSLLLFGIFTKMFEDLVDARIAIKHHDYEAVINMLGGKLAKYVTNDEDADALSKALKIPINSVYGLTSASFVNAFKDERNINNIVALKGALFMVNLRHEVEDRGYCVAHIKTDSIKIPNADDEIIKFVMDYGKQYGYTFEHEATYERMCLVNNAVYIAKYKGGKHDGEWTATGAEFQVPYVFKTLFSHEPIEFSDLCETRSVKSALYLDMNEGLGEGEHDYKFVGRVGLFCPVKAGCGGGLLMRESGPDKYAFATNCTGYRWLEAEDVRNSGREDIIDERYYMQMCDDAKEHISEFGDFDRFVNGGYIEPTPWLSDEELPF